MSQPTTSAYAIDFGTSNTVVARWNAATQSAETVSLPGLSQQMSENPPLVPSLVYVEDAKAGKIIAGQEVRDRGFDLTSDSRFWRGFKRGIGAPIPGFLPELEGVTVGFEQVGEWFLTRIIEQLLEREPAGIESLVLTVPVDSFDIYRNWLSGVCKNLSIPQIRLIDEPTAAALGYEVADNNVLLAIDFGGGTIDLSLVRLDLGQANTAQPLGFILKWGEKSLGESSAQKVKTAKVLAKVGQYLGGADIDNWLVDYFAEEQGVPKSSLIARLAERLKIQLSTQWEATEVYFNDETLESYELSLERERFEEILDRHQFFQQLDDLMVKLLQQGRLQGIDVTDIETVLLVGGSTQIPAVGSWVEKYFDSRNIKAHKPFEAIASGALQLARGVEVKDFLYHSYGIRYWNRRENRHAWHPIIKAGQAYPSSAPVELRLGASTDNQPKIELIIGELGAETGATEVYFEGDRLVTRSLGSGETSVRVLNDTEEGRTIATLNPPGFPGSDRVKLLFSVDSQRCLRLTVEDLLANETLMSDRIVAELS
ncbi:Hsp70 family protein [Oscillatoria sp. FACHB-1406]|uniref:Hsp70 family protein n=1 Tax=Oscillatoria sp. FACHB-1406 TaxID=2692846 RepID=UPI0016877F46|nr:Hsp70 family protein [Oscillatoria sp. FACHB-1406]MBD2579842.1 Hsp70 family protein [Oscillatoria sp. FACHB-1406]